ncbi:MAG: glycosyltransferase family 2 protein [Chthoniobacterales bacterium]
MNEPAPSDQSHAASLSVIVPLFNEEATIESILQRVLSQECVSQILVVDDASADGSFKIADKVAAMDSRVLLLRHSRNSGKGACIRTALPHATGDIVLIQDADLEYNPADYARLIALIVENRADVVIGNRRDEGNIGGRSRYFLQGFANRLSTWAANAFLARPLSDVHCGYKAFRRSWLQGIVIQESRFGVDIELALKASRMRARIEQVAIGYHARSYADGKKIGWRDALRTPLVIVKYGLLGAFTSPRRQAARTA